MKKQQVNLKNTNRTVSVEGYTYERRKNGMPALWEFKNDAYFPKESTVVEKIKDIRQYMIGAEDIYMMRIVYKYYKNKRCVLTKYTQFYFIQGEIVSKTQAVADLQKINEQVATEVSALPGEKVYRIRDKVFAINPQYNYEIIQEII